MACSGRGACRRDTWAVARDAAGEAAEQALVVLGIVAAVCWHVPAGGDLSGTGLDGRLSIAQSEGVLEELFRGVTGSDDLVAVAATLGYPAG